MNTHRIDEFRIIRPIAETKSPKGLSEQQLYLRTTKNRIGPISLASFYSKPQEYVKALFSGQPIKIVQPDKSVRPVDLPSNSAPFYKRWWFWASVGAVVTGLTLGAVFIYRANDQPLKEPAQIIRF